jgi:hypothetical protein
MQKISRAKGISKVNRPQNGLTLKASTMPIRPPKRESITPSRNKSIKRLDPIPTELLNYPRITLPQ